MAKAPESRAHRLDRFGAHSKCEDHAAECDGVTYRERVQFTTYTCGCSVVVLPSGDAYSNALPAPRRVATVD
jgi:hypothetical protein